MALFSQEFIERVRSANELSQVVASYSIQLKRAGTNLLGLCPFHNEKTPSFNIRTTEQFFRCFGCDAKGDVFRFVQMMEKVEFPEAVTLLAERAGLLLEYDDPVSAQQSQHYGQTKKALLRCCSLALDYFQECLLSAKGVPARSYLEGRKFEKQTIEQWRLGWAPDSWDGLCGFLLKNAKELGENEQIIQYALQAGLLRVSEKAVNGKKRVYDAFRGRVMFPILDMQFRPIAFGGRILEEKPEAGGKYINSPEGKLFEKRKVLFGLAQATKEISLSSEAVVVEGYTDVIMCHQYGIRNVIATLGTSLTEEHVGILRRYVREKGRVIAFFDGDKAGRMATRRAIDLFMEQAVPLAVAGRMELKDAGDFLPQYGAEAFRSKLAQAQDSFSYILEHTLGQVKGRDPQAMGLAVREALHTIDLCPDAVTRSLMRQRLAAEAGIPEETLPELVDKALAAPRRVAAVDKARPPKKYGLSPSSTALDMEEALAHKAAGHHRREARLLRYMWENPEWCARIMDDYPPDDWRDGVLAQLAAMVRDAWDMGRAPVLHDIRSRIADPDAAERLADLAFPDEEPLSEKDMSHVVSLMLGDNRDEEIRLLKGEIEKAEKAGDLELATAFLVKITQLKRAR